MSEKSTAIVNTLTPLANKSEKRFDYLDSLRGLAAMAVVLSHVIDNYNLPSWLSAFETTPLRFIRDGKAAVALFFVLSGFVLSYKYFKDNNMKGFNYPGYATARIFRIMPLFLVVLFISAIIRNYFFYHVDTIPVATSHFYQFWQGKISLTRVLKEGILIVRYPGESFLRMLPQDWTLTGELKQSLFLPVFIFIGLKNQWALLGVIAAILFFSPQNQVFYFYLGMVAAQNRSFFIEKWNSLHLSVKILMLFATVALYSYHLAYKPDYRFQGVASFLIILIALSSKRVQKFLNLKFLLLMGRLSFGIYLIHFAILLGFIPLFIAGLNAIGLVNHAVIILFAFVVLAALTIAVAYVAYNLVEIRGIRMGKQVAKVFKGNMFRKKRFVTNTEPPAAELAG